MKQILIFFCIKVYSLNATSRDKSLRIIGGRDAVPGEFPYALKMEMKGQNKDGDYRYIHVCTCTVIKPTWSLTAAHCIKGLEDYTSTLNVKGVIRHNFSSDKESSFSNILSMFKEPNYRETITIENDIGLLLSETIPVSRFAKLSSVDYFTLYGTKVLTLGYGVTIGSNGSLGDALSVNKPLQVLDAVITRCSSKAFSPAFCLGGICGLWPASRPGDSGGPVLHVSGIVGVCSGEDLSQGKTGYDKNKSLKLKIKMGRQPIAMYTPGSSYVDWITNVINSISL
ncbi:chymotrypsin-like elastase family member 1 [Vanessa tameamea]|uniref:Chymotrypsin-like elastase family member 1 n=1 Tax=Vanessa tameamea TaxID=334116 RepID=A0ABM4AYJ3_VANTA